MRLFPRTLVALSSAALAATLVGSPAQAAATSDFARWYGSTELGQGTRSSNVEVSGGAVSLTSGTAGSWTSPWVKSGLKAKSLVPSWTGTAPKGTYLAVEARVKSGSTTGSWDVVARWATHTDRVNRGSASSQTDDLAKMNTDIVQANSGKTFDSWQVRVTLRRSSSSGASPTLTSVNGIAATYLTRSQSTSSTTMTKTVDLAVPASSQMVHKNHYKQWDGGGAAWCSPTSASMVMRYAGLGPKSSYYAWTKESEGYIDHAARYSYDYTYEGTGNWAFTTAYAAMYGADAFVTRLSSLAEAESFIKAGIPVVISIAFSKGNLNGSPLTSTPGHLLVIRGFTSAGTPIVNDPAAGSNSSVRRTYSRAQLEKAWQGGSGGIAYIVRKSDQPLPGGTGSAARWLG